MNNVINLDEFLKITDNWRDEPTELRITTHCQGDNGKLYICLIGVVIDEYGNYDEQEIQFEVNAENAAKIVNTLTNYFKLKD